MIIMTTATSDYGSNPNTKEPIEILAADWQVATDKTFAPDTIRAQSLNNKTALTSIVMSDSLDPNSKWYGRVRHLLTTGWTEWSNIDVFTPITTDEIISYDDIPTRVANPIITTDSNPAKHDTTLFTITAEGYDVVGNASHVATTYFIEDINGDVIWSNEYDIINKTKFTVKDIVLQSGALYRIKVMFHASSNDTSLISSKTIFVDGGSEINLSKYLDVIKHDEDYEIEVNKLEGVDSLIFEIIAINDNNSLVIWKKETTGENYNKVIIPKNTLRRDNYYYLRIKTKKEDATFKYIPFRVDDFTNTDIMTKLDKKTILWVDGKSAIVKLGEKYKFTVEYYETVNHIIKLPKDKSELEVVYVNGETNKEDITIERDVFEVNIKEGEVTTKGKGHCKFYIRHKTNKNVKSPEIIIFVE